MTFAVARRTKAAKFESILTPGTDLERFEGSFTIDMKFTTEFLQKLAKNLSLDITLMSLVKLLENFLWAK